ncbi:hypothetical protein AB0M46_13360 [Dactylosporangium sp. NPDC051485]|uniref:hypothetical protein n=1 Tax=Dactylosporangium sp. NPDC051485 TaxID=3154846 RepID=UPI003445437D
MIPSSQPGHARSWIGGAVSSGNAGDEPGDEPEVRPGVPCERRTAAPPPEPPPLLGDEFDRSAGGTGGVGVPRDGCGPGVGPEPTTTGPGGGSATTGERVTGAVSRVALPAATTIIVGTEVSSTSSAEMNSGRRFGENSRWWRTSDCKRAPNVGDNRTNATYPRRQCPTWGYFPGSTRR